MEQKSFVNRIGMGALALGATLATATLLQAAITGTAYAADLPTQRALSLHGLDLHKPADVATAYERIRTAAELVCGDAVRTGSYLPTRAHVKCVAESINRTVTAIGKAELSSYARQAAIAAGA